ncbi:tetratricopeptide repeat protein [Kovacikia minuta CCNUW1]|uniref:O-linked N-acetylglucosamine transferase family protein n=1 Tax=Kovacikia minuta TaxID=2931930 RepID=UPI001CCDE0FF|nr:tetratricopeptide repeat protein [Kovacikia minuta]UBF27734.1 tetratricopeptide repeat protein [Kovacikia minuta CCNUW1]
MDFQRLINDLPALYQDWELPTVRPVSAQFQEVLKQLEGTTEANVPQLLNAAVECMAEGEVYCEVGCAWGIHLVSALWNHPNKMAYAVETPAQIDSEGDMIDLLMENLSRFNLQEQVFFCCQDLEEFFVDLGEAGLEDRIGVYFYNSVPDYRSQLLGLLLAKPFLADQALIVLGQADLSMVRQAAWDFLVAHPQAKLLLDLSATHTGHVGFGRGLLVLGWDNTVSQPNRLVGWDQRRDLTVVHALQGLELQQRAKNLHRLRKEAAQALVEGRVAEAEQKYLTILLYERGDAEVWQNLGMLYYLVGKDDDALEALTTCLKLNPGNAALPHHISGLVLERKGQADQAIEAFQQAIELNPVYADSLNSLGELLMKQGDLSQAKLQFQQAIAAAPDRINGYVNLGNVFLKQNQPQEAIAEYHKALAISPQDPDLLQKLGTAYGEIGDFAQAHLYRFRSLYYQSFHEEAIEHFQAQLGINQLETYNDCLMLYDCFSQCGLTQEAIQCIEAAARLRPDDVFLKVAPHFVLPSLYQTSDEISFYRQRYLKGYEILAQKVEKAVGNSEPISITSIENFTNFYLSFQGYNDRAVHQCYSELLRQVMVKRCSASASSLPMPPVGGNGKIRIGYIANSLGNNSETRWAVGWLKNHDRSQFEIYSYSIESDSDLRTEQFKHLSDAFYHLPNHLDAICQRILSDQLHILVFLALGSGVKPTALATLRLAPIQCSAWGHPVTSGSPTIDYFLSSELMEADNAQEHYTEQLVRLPNIGICYPQPQFPKPNQTRADFGLRQDAVIYLSCQLLFKYLPQHDYLFTRIVQRVPQAQLVFVLRSTINNQTNPSLERQFQQRLRKAFADVGLNMEDHCLFLPGQDMQGYVSLLSCADVFLDTLAFSGGHTTLDAIAANLPVVCCPGELMRGRQSYGALKLLGVIDTIAQTEAEYIDIAVRLGLEPEWRAAIVQQMSKSHANLFEDKTSVVGLEKFYRQVVQEQLAQQEIASKHPSEVSSTPAHFKSILHVGCGPYYPEALPAMLRTPAWREIRLDINPAVNPDIIGSITDLSAVSDASVDAVYSSHNLEHIYAHEVPIALSEFYRVVKSGGFALITLPDIQAVAAHVAEGKLEEVLYVSPAGPISAIDILYGLRTEIAAGNEYMAHRTAFTSETLSQKLQEAGFTQVKVEKEGLNLWAKGYKQ